MTTSALGFIAVGANPSLAQELATAIDAGASASVSRLMTLGGLPSPAAVEVTAQCVSMGTAPTKANERLMGVGIPGPLASAITVAIDTAYP